MVNQNISRTYGKTFEKGSPNSNDELFSLTYRSKQKSRSLQAKPIECLKKKKKSTQCLASLLKVVEVNLCENFNFIFGNNSV